MEGTSTSSKRLRTESPSNTMFHSYSNASNTTMDLSTNKSQTLLNRPRWLHTNLPHTFSSTGTGTVASLSASQPVPLSSKQTMCVLSANSLCKLFEVRPTDSDNQKHFLFGTPSGDIQRNLDHEHLNDLVSYQQTHLEKHGCYSFPTSIIVAEFEGKIAIVDGQHRVETIRYLTRTNHEHTLIEQTYIPVIVIQLSAPSEYDNVFVAVNKNKPVQLYIHMDAWKTLLKGVEQHFRVNYSPYIKEKSERPLVPHINLKKLLEYLDVGDYARRLGLTVEQFLVEVEALNSCYYCHWKQLISKKHVKQIQEWGPKCIAKQPFRPLMLGIFRQFEWVDRIALKVLNPKTYPSYEQMVHVPVSYRPTSVIRHLKRVVWSKRHVNNQMVGECYVCNRELHYDDMECGHVVSVFAGGQTCADNLEPICGNCNRDMGIENLDTYRKKVQTMCGINGTGK